MLEATCHEPDPATTVWSVGDSEQQRSASAEDEEPTDAVLRVLGEHDPEGLLDVGAPADEYQPEAEHLARLASKNQTITAELVTGVWHESGRMFTQPNGEALDPRHTTATVLLILDVSDRVITEWSSVAMKQRYTHVTEGVRRDVADQLNSYFRES